jgi:hypothetical protein
MQTITLNRQVGIVAATGFMLMAFLSATPASADTKVRIRMPQTFTEAIGMRTYQNRGPAFACNVGERVKTCDANTAASMPKPRFIGGSSYIVLGKATNKALLGLKMTTQCTGTEVNDFARFGCVYEGCLGYKKPIVMVCGPKKK